MIDGDGQCWRGCVKHYNTNHFTQNQTAAHVNADGCTRCYSGCSHRQALACKLDYGAFNRLASGPVCLQGPDNRRTFELWSGMEREASHVRLIGTKIASGSFFAIPAKNADKEQQKAYAADGYGSSYERIGNGRLTA